MVGVRISIILLTKHPIFVDLYMTFFGGAEGAILSTPCVRWFPSVAQPVAPMDPRVDLQPLRTRKENS